MTPRLGSETVTVTVSDTRQLRTVTVTVLAATCSLTGLSVSVPVSGYAHRMAKLDAAEVERRVADLQGWGLRGNAISRQFEFRSFPDAIAFVTRLAFDAEGADHHPDVLISYKRVTLTYSTHSEGGLTKKDFDGAKNAEALAAAMPKSSA
jgi:4a-hydroxytetrahydrobiopterin dehydratase